MNHAPSTGGVVDTTDWTQQEAYCPYYYWNEASTLVQPETAWGKSSGHASNGFAYNYHNSTYLTDILDQPAVQLSPPYGPITMNPGVPLLSQALINDDHPSYDNANQYDNQPLCTSGIDVPSNTIRYTATGYDEIICVANVVSGAAPNTWRISHNFNSGCNAYYASQNSLPKISPLGDIIIFGTDMWGTRNAWPGAGNGGVASNNLCEAQKNVAGMTLNLGDNVYPPASNNGNFVYQSTTSSLCVTTGAIPTGGWCQTLTCTATWGACTVKAIGVNNGRADVVAVDLLSAHAAP